jgi:hypothetical protein
MNISKVNGRDNDMEQVQMDIDTHLLITLSAILKSIIKFKTLDELFHDICRIMIEEGGFSVCWIGKPDIINKKYGAIASYNVTDQDRQLGNTGR